MCCTAEHFGDAGNISHAVALERKCESIPQRFSRLQMEIAELVSDLEAAAQVSSILRSALGYTD